jgi:hypothetical protein
MFKLLNRSFHLVRTGALWKNCPRERGSRIYISGHPLDDYKFEMKYFCNAKLEALRSLEHHVGK